MATREIKTFQIKMFEPDHMELAQVLQDGLRKHFEEATVEWVDCPNLTQTPFSHTAAGLCGDAVLLKIGNESNLFCQIPQMQVRYEFENILRAIYSNHSDALIIGEGFGLRNSTQEFGNLYMNAFWQLKIDHYTINNQSYIGFWNNLTGKFLCESIHNFNLACYMHGIFFISEGKTGKVLRVYARKPLTNHPFTLKLHQVLSEKYFPLFSSLPSLNLMGLSGTFFTKYGVTNQPVIRSCDDEFKTSEKIFNWISRDNLSLPKKSYVAFTIDKNNFNNYSLFCDKDKIYGHGPSELNSKNSIYNMDLMESDGTIEVLGFLYPAQTLYHVDPQSTLLFEYDS